MVNVARYTIHGYYGFWKVWLVGFESSNLRFTQLAEVKGLYIGVQAVLALYAQWVRETRGFQPEGPGTCFFLLRR